MFDIVKGFSTILFAALLDNLLYFLFLVSIVTINLKSFVEKKILRKTENLIYFKSFLKLSSYDT